MVVNQSNHFFFKKKRKKRDVKKLTTFLRLEENKGN